MPSAEWSAQKVVLNAFVFAWLKRSIQDLKRELGPALKDEAGNFDHDLEYHVIIEVFKSLYTACDRLEREILNDLIRRKEKEGKK